MTAEGVHDRPSARERWPLKSTWLTLFSERLLWSALLSVHCYSSSRRCPASASSRSPLPDPVIGNALHMNQWTGALCGAISTRQWSRNSSNPACAPPFRNCTAAQTVSPHLGSGLPKTTAMAMAGCAIKGSRLSARALATRCRLRSFQMWVANRKGARRYRSAERAPADRALGLSRTAAPIGSGSTGPARTSSCDITQL